jgi:hypothetical protein
VALPGGLPVTEPQQWPPVPEGVTDSLNLRLRLGDHSKISDPVAVIPRHMIIERGMVPVLVEALRGVADEFERQYILKDDRDEEPDSEAPASAEDGPAGDPG